MGNFWGGLGGGGAGSGGGRGGDGGAPGQDGQPRRNGGGGGGGGGGGAGGGRGDKRMMKTMRIFVKGLSFNKYPGFEMDEHATVDDLKAIIIKYHPNWLDCDYDLLYDNRQLREGKLTDQNIIDGSTVHLVVRLPGGV